jgi:hypothetical protein
MLFCVVNHPRGFNYYPVPVTGTKVLPVGLTHLLLLAKTGFCYAVVEFKLGLMPDLFLVGWPDVKRTLNLDTSGSIKCILYMYGV